MVIICGLCACSLINNPPTPPFELVERLEKKKKSHTYNCSPRWKCCGIFAPVGLIKQLVVNYQSKKLFTPTLLFQKGSVITEREREASSNESLLKI